MCSADVKRAFDPESFRNDAHRVVDLLAGYLQRSSGPEKNTVLPAFSPAEMDQRWNTPISDKPKHELIEMMNNVIDDSHHLHSPHYVGHQVSTPLPLSAISDFVASLLNNASAVYDMGPVNIIHEKRIIEWMIDLIGYGSDADGILTSGGTLGNLTALLAARQVKADVDVWSEGVGRGQTLAIMVSEQCHYSVRRAAGVMGIGTDNVIQVPTGSDFKMKTEALEKCLKLAVDQGKSVFAVAANGCSTATGTYDDLNLVADFCQKHDLWFHVDGAHGASALLSEEYKYLLAGVDRADSIVWDAHKMLLVPALITAVIFKNGADSYRSFSQKASYLFEKGADEEWYNYAHRTMECTKTMMGLKLYVPLMIYGTDFFRKYIDQMYGLCREFAAIVHESSDFELAVEPEANIICFRYINSSNADLDDLQKKIRAQILQSEDFYLVQAQIDGITYLRCTLINPLTEIQHLNALLDTIRRLVF